MFTVTKPIIVWKKGKLRQRGKLLMHRGGRSIGDVRRCLIQLLLKPGTRCTFDPNWSPYVKCRGDKAFVVAIRTLGGRRLHGVSAQGALHFYGTTYRVGRTVKPNGFNTDETEVCSNGIHFFANRDAAVHF